jgi:hypothetical protein
MIGRVSVKSAGSMHATDATLGQEPAAFVLACPHNWTWGVVDEGATYSSRILGAHPTFGETVWLTGRAMPPSIW